MRMHYEALDEKRRALLPALGDFKKDFYLAGGTALALQIGHRVSVDFDFFTEKDFETEELYDIGCMKLSAIVSRSELKDYVDVFFILKRLPLTALLIKLAEKIPSLDQNLVLKALVSFDDIQMEPIDFIKGNDVSFDKIQASIIESVKSVPLGIR